MFKEYIMGYEVERKNVKNINLRIRNDMSIYISAPIRLDKYYIEQFIISKKDWIDSNIKKIKSFKDNFKEPDYSNGSKIRLRGLFIDLEVIKSDFDKVVYDKDKITLYTILDEFEYKKKLIYQFYYKEALKIIEPLVYKWKDIMEEDFNRLIIKAIKGKWGYCNYNKKIIALSIELIKRSIFEIEYVIIHELAHLKHPNHSKEFYRHIQRYMINYKEAEKMLKIY